MIHDASYDVKKMKKTRYQSYEKTDHSEPYIPSPWPKLTREFNTANF